MSLDNVSPIVYNFTHNLLKKEEHNMEETATDRVNKVLAELHLANKMMAELFGLEESEDN